MPAWVDSAHVTGFFTNTENILFTGATGISNSCVAALPKLSAGEAILEHFQEGIEDLSVKELEELKVSLDTEYYRKQKALKIENDPRLTVSGIFEVSPIFDGSVKFGESTSRLIEIPKPEGNWKLVYEYSGYTFLEKVDWICEDMPVVRFVRMETSARFVILPFNDMAGALLAREHLCNDRPVFCRYRTIWRKGV